MKLPIYLNKNYIIDDLPPETNYSTFPYSGHIIVGYIVSDNHLKVEYQGVWGAFHEADGGFFSTHSLIRCAFGKLYGLSWESA